MISKIGFLLIAAALVCCNAKPPCTCTRELKPVCGSDGITYPNVCMLNCAKHSFKTDIEVLKVGPCEGCLCTMEYQPVCGNDENTYPNACEAKCHEAQVEYYGECENKIKVVEIPPCTCTKETKRVCGTDGATYSNSCLLNCATAADSTLGIANQGPCEELEVVKVESAEPEVVKVDNEEPCTCTRNFTPVCGSDGVTYNNECLLRCAGKTKTRDIACEEVQFVDNN